MISPCLWFDGKAEEAMNFYLAHLPQRPGHRRDALRRRRPRLEGLGADLHLRVDGQEFIALNGPPIYQFTPAVSFVVKCETQAEVDGYWDRLLVGGKAQMRDRRLA
jgi:predicted 3-demethylubiquinone-9 3-methyltransferase (glyoxalase superfamily)